MKSIQLFTLLLALLSFSSCGNDDDPVIVTSDPCAFPGAPESVAILPASLEGIAYSSMNNATLNFHTENDEANIFTISNSANTVFCLHEWICEENSEERETYWAERLIETSKLTSESMEVEVQAYATFNEHSPLEFHDLLKVNIHTDTDTTCCVFRFILDPRTDLDANNAGLQFSETLELNGYSYENVYSNESADDHPYIVYYTVEDGVVGVRDENAGSLLNLE